MNLVRIGLLALICLVFAVTSGCNGTVAIDDDDSVGDDDDSASDDDDSAADDDDSADDVTVDADGDGFAGAEDCDDTDAAIHPMAGELCDQVDNDCDGAIDESDADDAPTWYEDGDGDGYGLAGSEQIACNQPHGYSAYSGDCNDTDPSYHPGATESDCTDPNDYNCDGSVGYEDVDSDGVAACEDCDDTNIAVNPAASEACNTLDDDCDGLIDEAGATGEATWYLDADGDGYGRMSLSQISCSQQPGYVDNANDCDDLDASSYPGGTEVCDGADNNCDNSVDEGVLSTFYGDADGDGYGDPGLSQQACFLPAGASVNDQDCNDAEPAVHPGGIELCDGLDNDCDNSIDNDALNATTWYVDSDGDGFGDPLTGSSSCDAIANTVSNGLDCNDSDGGNYPGNSETCDGDDENCNSSVDEGFDIDGDGVTTCGVDGLTGSADDDCDDLDQGVYPGATEVCDGEDEDCSGIIDNGFDADGDGTTTCGPDGVQGTLDDDCDDSIANDGYDGVNAACAASSCQAIAALGTSLPDGNYWLDDGVSGPFETHCDMTSDGGGWTCLTASTTETHVPHAFTNVLNNCSVSAWLSGAVRFGEPGSCNAETVARLSLSLPFTYSQFFLEAFESTEEPGGGTWEIDDSGDVGDYSGTTWGTAANGGWGDVTFGSLDNSTPTTSYAEQSSANLQCSGCTWVFGANGTIFNLGSTSSDFTIEAIQGGGDVAESILVWTAGSICLR